MYIRLPLDGTTNTRDLGGYAGFGKKVTKWKKLLRSDCVSRLTAADKDYLVNEYQLAKVIDLRSPKEAKEAPNAFASDERVIYINLSLSFDVNPNEPIGWDIHRENLFGNFYVDILENKKEQLKKVFEEIMNVDDGDSVLFHCTAGKDRTGVVAMLILGLCGVSRQDIATNYMQTATNLKYNAGFSETNKKMMGQFIDINDEILKKMASSDEEYIEYCYDHLIEKYKTFKDYFLSIGFSEESMDQFVKATLI